VGRTIRQYGRIAKFLLVGLAATALQFAVLAAGTSWLGLGAALSSGVGYLMGSLVSYCANYFLTFASAKRHSQAMPQFYTMVGAAWLLTIGLMALMVDWLGWNQWVGQVVATSVCLVFNYLCSRDWVYRSPCDEETDLRRRPGF
jgi:putative flippase GtrA